MNFDKFWNVLTCFLPREASQEGSNLDWSSSTASNSMVSSFCWDSYCHTASQLASHADVYVTQMPNTEVIQFCLKWLAELHGST